MAVCASPSTESLADHGDQGWAGWPGLVPFSSQGALHLGQVAYPLWASVSSLNRSVIQSKGTSRKMEMWAEDNEFDFTYISLERQWGH